MWHSKADKSSLLHFKTVNATSSNQRELVVAVDISSDLIGQLTSELSSGERNLEMPS